MFAQVNHYESSRKSPIPEVDVKTKECPVCGARMKRNGKTGAGTQRWRCVECGSSAVHRHDSAAKELSAFLGWLMSKGSQADMPGGGRTFRRRSRAFWEIWPMPDAVDEVHRVVFVDGIYVARDLVVLIACTREHVLSWYVARAETSRAWRALLSRIAPPDMVVTDGGSGFARACAAEWPETKVQRCLFHAFCQVKRYTTSRPKLQAGRELYGLALELMALEDPSQARWWVERYMQWCAFWSDFLEERTLSEGRLVYTHERIRKARSSLSSLVSKGTLFTYLDPALAAHGPLPRTNNMIEGGVNSQLRAMLRNHRGLSELRRVKAVFWWCYMHTECPKGAAEVLRSMPTDEDIDLLYELYSGGAEGGDGPSWGDRPVWQELHHQTPCPYYLD